MSASDLAPTAAESAMGVDMHGYASITAIPKAYEFPDADTGMGESFAPSLGITAFEPLPRAVKASIASVVTGASVPGAIVAHGPTLSTPKRGPAGLDRGAGKVSQAEQVLDVAGATDSVIVLHSPSLAVLVPV